ncbi:MAG TPA: PAS domain-containing protein [Clostridia bacterium]|nr:PAS domain-containing protein [Clostridia bacterium]
MNSNREKLLKYVTMADYIAEMNGQHAETLIHDISDYNHSIIYITPRNITGRKIGGSLTDYAIKLLESKTYEQDDYVVNYIGNSSLNNLILRSSTYFIKDNGKLIGLLCTNIDITDQIKAIELAKEALLVDFDHLNQTQASETFSLTTDELINKIYAKAVAHKGRKKLDVADKRKIVLELSSLNVFKIKGTISTVAALIKVSEKTVYRYLNEDKK